MKQYIGTKIIKAKPMSRGEYNIYRGWTIPADEDPADEGYLVKYSDDYVSWSPKDVFEEAYRQCDNMTFGLALEALKKGFKVARKGWNGKNQFLVYIDPYDNEQFKLIEEAPLGTFYRYVAIKTNYNAIVPWIASQTDMLAEDWYVR